MAQANLQCYAMLCCNRGRIALKRALFDVVVAGVNDGVKGKEKEKVGMRVTALRCHDFCKFSFFFSDEFLRILWFLSGSPVALQDEHPMVPSNVRSKLALQMSSNSTFRFHTWLYISLEQQSNCCFLVMFSMQCHLLQRHDRTTSECQHK